MCIAADAQAETRAAALNFFDNSCCYRLRRHSAVANCASCHGRQGEGDDDDAVPMLAGQHSAYLLRQMYDAVDGRRPALTQLHSQRINPLDFEQLHAVADFLSQLGSGN